MATVSVHDNPGWLQETGCEGGADGDQDEGAEEFAALAGPGADLGAQFQAEQGQGDADGADGDGGDGQPDVERAEGEPDGEVVDAERQAGDDEPRAALGVRRGRSLAVGPDGLDERPGAGGDEQASADPAGGVAEGMRQAVAEREPGDRHAGLEQAEDDADLQPGTGAGAGDPDTDRGREVGQAEGNRDQGQGQHELTLVPHGQAVSQREAPVMVVILAGCTRRLGSVTRPWPFR